MAELSQYNTLAEAIAFNLQKEDIEELGLLDYNGIYEINHISLREIYCPLKNILYRKGLYDEVMANNQNTYNFKNVEFETKDNLFSCKYTPQPISYFKTNSKTREIDLNHADKFKNMSYYGEASSAINGTLIANYFHQDTKKIMHFGNFDKNIYQYALYNSFKDNFINKLSLRSKLTEEGRYYYAPITDFRYMPNKKVIKLSELQDNSFFELLNLVPNNTIGFIFNNLTYSNTVDNTLYEQFIVDIVNGQDIISSLEKLEVFEKKYQNKYTIFFRAYNAIYFGYYNDLSIMAMFVNDNKLDYPLNENGYIDYNSIDYSKEYTSGLGAAKVNPKIISKMIGWSWAEAKAFTNQPDPDLPAQGVSTKISISNQIFRPSNNTATLTITLGHCIVDGITYNDELGTITSKNKFINVVDNKDGTYTISFRNTTNPQTDFIYIPIKNTFNGITINNFYELELVKDEVTEVIRMRQTSYNVTVSNCQTISGYLFYERKTALTDDEKNNLKQADIAKAFEFLNTNIVSFPRLSPFDPTDIKSISYTNREILCIFKGKTLTKSEQYRAGKYHYDIQTIGSKVSTSLDITLITDPSQPIVSPPNGNPPTNPSYKPPGYRPPGGGIGPGNGGDSGGNDNPPSSNFTEDDGEDIPKRDLNEDEVKEPITPPDNSSTCSIPSTSDDFTNLSDYLEFVSKETTTDPIYTDESLIGAGREGDGSVTLAKNYQGGYVWTYPISDGNGGVKLGTIYTNAPYLMPKITTTITYKVKYKKESSKGDNTDENGDSYISFSFWQYAQDFTEVSDKSTTEGTQIKGGEKSSYFANISSIGKATWNKYNPDNHQFTENDFRYEFDGQDVNIFMRWKFPGVGLEPSEGYFSIRDVFNICIYMEGLTEEQLRESYNIPESDIMKVTEAPTGSVLDENNFNIVFSTTNNQNWLVYDFNFTDTSKNIVYGTYDFRVTLTDKNGLSYTKDFTKYDMRVTGKRYIYFYNNEIQTGANQTFDVTNITNVKFEILEKRDFMGSVIPNKQEVTQ